MSLWLESPAHVRWLEAESERLLRFSRASRHPAGGFAWLDTAGQPDLDRPVELWVTCRMTHVFALGHLMGRRGCGPLVDHGVRALTGRFHDDLHSGWYGEATSDGPTARGKTAYDHAFVVLAAASATSAARPGARALLDDALEVFLGRFWDEEHGMVVEEWDETFSAVAEYRGVNANMHSVEAMIAAADTTGDRGLLQRAQRIVDRVVHVLARAHGWRIPEHFDSDWNPDLNYNRDTPAHPFRPFGATIGHSFEWSRLALHLRAALGEEAPASLLPDTRSLFDAAVREGWSVDGRDGFVYTVDWQGHQVVRERMHWVAAEAIAAAAALAKATGEARYDDWYRVWWDYVDDVFIDRQLGSWRHELDPRNRPSDRVWKGKPDTYHALQATLIPRLPLAPSMATALRDGLLV